MQQCTIEACSRKFVAKGYCQEHYDKYRRYGNPLRGEKKEPLVNQILSIVAEYEEETKDNPDRIPAEDIIYLFNPQLHTALYV